VDGYPPVAAPPSVVELARRLGPLPYSALGRRSAPRPPGADLAGWLAAAVDRSWHDQGRPDPFWVVEVGAGDGSRAGEVLGLGPECLAALRYVLVETDPVLAAEHGRVLPLESPFLLQGPAGPPGDADAAGDERVALSGVGPLVASLPALPALDGAALVVAVATLGCEPADRVQWSGGRWREVRLAAGTDPATLIELTADLDDRRAEEVARLVERAGAWVKEGDRLALLVGARQWLSRAVRAQQSGELLVVDRWVAHTGPIGRRDPAPLALDQLVADRKPIQQEPSPAAAGMAAVAWRLG
jgi:hypothetical protein